MAEVFLICGRICCGKTTYAARLRADSGAVLLSVDEIMLSIFGPYAGDKHDEYAERIRNYLFKKSIEIIESGTSVILDWGFWTESGRIYAKNFYESRGIKCELHYIDVTDEIWRERIRKRNRLAEAGAADAYPIDRNLMEKFMNLFEPPSRMEADVWISD